MSTRPTTADELRRAYIDFFVERAHIEEVFSQWSPEEREDLLAVVRRLTRELVPDVQSGGKVVAS